MTHEQEQAFRASTNNADPNLLNLLFIGTLVAVLFLWAAFAFVTVYRGWEAGNVSERPSCRLSFASSSCWWSACFYLQVNEKE